ncbi:MAG: Ribosomal RNA large subunit methyltransferase M [Turneriella sp.]|nr:Ribosomal RNA large subunit methyltransferase M [Turneriella sp.]
MLCVYFIRDELRPEFLSEAKYSAVPIHEISKNVFLSDLGKRLYWVLDFWPNVEKISFTSITDAAKKLRLREKKLDYVGASFFRRGKLIADTLKVAKEKIVKFNVRRVDPPCGAFTLLDANTLLYSARTLKRGFAGGKILFAEDKIGPPSRAYLKLWEVLTLTQNTIKKGERVLDLGGTPGGWSYVAASLGATVTLVDRSMCDAKLLKRFSTLRFLKGDGLKADKTLLGETDILLSDMACDSQKLLYKVREWVHLPHLKFMVCTLKFSGVSNKDIIYEFAKIPYSQIYHLWNNGHELTWVWEKK